ncbi:MAG: hypothetical protein AAGA42_13195 [Actinomycetota bacterium]
MPGPDDDELARLRALVGPSERAYGDAVADADRAIATAKAATLEAGAVRGELAEMRVELARARQDQDLFQRRRAMSAAEYLVDLVREAWREVLRPRLAHVARRVPMLRGRETRGDR